MNAELDYDLLPDQWEALKALRAAATQRRVPSQFVIEQLVALGLANTSGERPRDHGNGT